MPIQIRPGNSALVKFGHGDVLISFHPPRQVSGITLRPAREEHRIGEFVPPDLANGLGVTLSFDGPAAIDCVIECLDVLRRQMRAGVKNSRAATRALIDQSALPEDEKQRLRTLLKAKKPSADEGEARTGEEAA
jgi:hypothetical protein